MTTPIRISPSSLREGRWYEYVIRFALGGAATVFTGVISNRYGASIGGLSGERRGQMAAALDSAGAALGSVGMFAFAVVFWLLVERSIAGAFAGASLAWSVVSIAAWYARRKIRSNRRTSAREKGRPAMPRSRPF